MQDFDSTLLLEVALDLANSINNDDRFDGEDLSFKA